MAASLINLQGIALTFGGTPLLTGADLNITPGARICLVGRNGSGKSTLMKVAAGLLDFDAGERFTHPDANIRYLPQEADFSNCKTTREAVEAGLGPTDDAYKAHMLLNELGLTGEEDAKNLSGGEARRTAIVQAIVSRPDVLLLDEPTNHLDISAIDWLEAHLKPLKAAIVTISHDRRFLENMSRATVWLDRGRTKRLDNSFGAFENWRDQELENEEKARHKLDRKIAREEQWLHGGGISGRRKRNMRRVGELKRMRLERAQRRSVQGSVKLEATDGNLASRLVFEAIGISKTYGDTDIVKSFSTRVLRGDRVGIVGPNGTGKTTLLNLVTGGLKPDTGRVRAGKNLQVVTMDQKRETLKPKATVAETLTGGSGDQVILKDRSRHVVGYMKDFLFSPEQARTPVSVLSGGERCRLMLARALARPSNVLVLDEPTNDLDLETLDLLEEMLADYEGTVILVSHDRDFLDRIVTSVIVSDGGGRWIEYAGGYADMLAQRNGVPPRANNATNDPVEDVTRKKPSRDKTATPDVKATSKRTVDAKRTKLSFKDVHALQTLPGQIEALQSETAKLEAQLSASDSYAKDPQAFDAATKRLAQAMDELASAENLWLELEMKREEIEG